MSLCVPVETHVYAGMHAYVCICVKARWEPQVSFCRGCPSCFIEAWLEFTEQASLPIQQVLGVYLLLPP